MTISKDRLVQLDYRLSDGEGNLLNPDDGEIIYLHGHGQIFEKAEAALEGKGEGESVSVDLAPAEAFGEHREELVAEEMLSELPEDVFVGMELEGYLDENPEDVIVYVVTHIGERSAVLDGNHPLAGKALRFEATVTEVQELEPEAVREILEHSHDHDHHH